MKTHHLTLPRNATRRRRSRARAGIAALAAAAVSLSLSPLPAAAVELEGEWLAIATTDEGKRELTWTLRRTDAGYSGKSVDRQSGDTHSFDRINVDGERVTIEVGIERDGESATVRIDAEATAADRLAGQWALVGGDGARVAGGKLVAERLGQGGVGPAPTALAGEWQSSSVMPDGEVSQARLLLRADGDGLSGSFVGGDGGSVGIDKIALRERAVRMQFDLDIGGENVDIVIEAAVAEGGDELAGMWIAKDPEGGEAAKGKWWAERAPFEFAGTWSVTAVTPDGGYRGELEIARGDGGWKGRARSGEGELELDSVTVDGGTLRYAVGIDGDAGSGTISVEAKPDASGALVGKWRLSDADGTVVASDVWRAERQKQ